MQSTGLWLYILIILGFQLAESDKNYSNAVRSFRYKQLQAQQLLSRAGIRFKIVKIPSNTVSISPAILSRQVQVKRSRHHDKKGSEWLLLNSQFKKPPEYESHRNYNLNYNRLPKEPFTNLDISMEAYSPQDSRSSHTNRDTGSNRIFLKDTPHAPTRTPRILARFSVGAARGGAGQPSETPPRPQEPRIFGRTSDPEHPPRSSYPVNYNTGEQRDKMQLSQSKKEVQVV